MTLGATLVWGAPQWLAAAAVLAAASLALLLWGYWRAGASRGVRLIAGGLKTLGILILALCLLEPLFSGTRARPGANAFVVLSDNSQSMTLRDSGGASRSDAMKSLAAKDAAWLAQLGRDFDLRRYAFDTQLRALGESEELSFDGRASNLGASLERLARRYQGRPLVELRDKVAEELLRREASEALVPIDREPVPADYVEQVRRYYERLGSGR